MRLQLSYKSIIPEARSVRVYGGAGIVAGTSRPFADYNLQLLGALAVRQVSAPC